MLIRKDVTKLFLPVLVEQLLFVSLGVINTIMVSRVGKSTVSAIGMIDTITTVLNAFFHALVIGSTVVVAHYIGQKNIEQANSAAKQGLFSGLVISSVISALVIIFKTQILHLFYGAAEKTVMNNSLLYLGIIVFTYPMIALTNISCGVLRGAGDTKTPMKVNAIMNVLNVVLSYFLIYGIHINTAGIIFNMPGLTVRGAAIGIMLARLAGTVIVLTILFRGTKIIKLDHILLFRPDRKILKSIFAIAIPQNVESFLFTFGRLVMQVFIVGMGTVSIASNSISNSVLNLINVPGNALCTTSTTLVGQSMGRKDNENAKGTMIYITLFSTVCYGIICILSYIFAENIAAVYSRDTDVILLTANIIRITSISVPLFWSASFVLPAGLKGTGDAKYTMITSIIGMWVFRIALGYYLAIVLNYGVMGIWTGMFFDWFIRCFMYGIRLYSGLWKRNVVVTG